VTKILIVGAGAIGGFLGARLSTAGHDITVLARGAHLQAIQKDGLRLEDPNAHLDVIAQVRAIGDLQDAGEPEVVMVTLKAYQVAPIAGPLAQVSAKARIYMPIQNGIGWWYFQRHGGPRDGTVITAIDPNGELAAKLPVASTIPAFAFKSAQVVSPGVVRHIADPSDYIAMGELDGTYTDRMHGFGAELEQAGITVKYGDPRDWMWQKLLGNVFANPLCALTRRVLGDVVRCAPTRALALDLMREVCSVSSALGHVPMISLEARLKRAEAMSAAKPSMLQDLEAGRPMETEAILGALIELAEIAQVKTPIVRTLHACLQLIEYQDTDRSAGNL